MSRLLPLSSLDGPCGDVGSGAASSRVMGCRWRSSPSVRAAGRRPAFGTSTDRDCGKSLVAALMRRNQTGRVRGSNGRHGCGSAPWPRQRPVLLRGRFRWLGSGYGWCGRRRSEEHTSELQSRENLVCRLLLEKKKKKIIVVLFALKIKIEHNVLFVIVMS